MKHWAQFYELRNGSYVEPCGDRQLVFIDGRLSRANMEAIAASECDKRKYDGWRLARGNSLLTPFYLNAAIRTVKEMQ